MVITGWHYNHSRIRNIKYCTYSIRISTVNIGHDGSLSMADDINLYIIPVTFIKEQKSTTGFYFSIYFFSQTKMYQLQLINELYSSFRNIFSFIYMYSCGKKTFFENGICVTSHLKVVHEISCHCIRSPNNNL